MTSTKKATAPRQEVGSLSQSNAPDYSAPSISVREIISPATRKAAIEQHCKACIHDPGSPGTWRQQTAECTSKTCALWAFRPTPSNGAHETRTSILAPELA